MKRIIVYYSLTGNTKEAAGYLAGLTGADICELRTVKPMPEGMFRQMMTGGRQAVFSAKPKLEPFSADLSEYDEIILGTPVWAARNAAAVNTFLKDKSVRGKVTGVFTLSGGGDNESCMKRLGKKLLNIKASVALADRSNGLSKDNISRLDAFAKETADV